MNNVYETPKSDLTTVENQDINNSGLKQNVYPDGVAGVGAHFA